MSIPAGEDARVVSDLLEAFSDPMFEAYGLAAGEMRELVETSPSLARAVLTLYRAYQTQRESTESLASKVMAVEGGVNGVDRAQVPSEEVNDLLQKHLNHFPELEQAAEDLWKAARLEPGQIGAGLARQLENTHGIEVRSLRHANARGVLRRFDPERKVLGLSELLPTRSRAFQMAHQIALLSCKPALDRLALDPLLTSNESSALANYFAGAVLMPYAPFFEAVREERYDIDVAGNISKRFSASGIHFARFSGACPKWNLFAAFTTPGMLRIQVSRMPDGAAYFCIARTIQKESGGYREAPTTHAIALGCQAQHAAQMVYADGVDLQNLEAATPVGVTCRSASGPTASSALFLPCATACRSTRTCA